MSIHVRVSCDEGCGEEIRFSDVAPGRVAESLRLILLAWGCDVGANVCAECIASRTAPHRTALSPQLSNSSSNSQNHPRRHTQMREMSKGEGARPGSIPGGVTSSDSENSSVSRTAPEQSAVSAHTEAGAEAFPPHFGPRASGPVGGRCEVCGRLPRKSYSPASWRWRDGRWAGPCCADGSTLRELEAQAAAGAGAVRVEGEGLPATGVPGPSPRFRGDPDRPCELCDRFKLEHFGGGAWCTELPPAGEVPLPDGPRCQSRNDYAGRTVRCELAQGHEGGHWHTIDEIGGIGWPSRAGESPPVRPCCADCKASGIDVSGALFVRPGCCPGCGQPLTEPACACGSVAFEVRPGMSPGRIACMGCGAERWKAPPDRVVNEGGEGRVTWKLSARLGMFAGEVRVSGELAASFVAASSEEVTRKMLAYVDGVLDPRDTRVPYESPAITSKLVEVQALMGLHRLGEAIEKRVEDQRHAQLRARSRIIDEALGWWEGYQRAWSEAPALRDADAATVQACRALCDRLVTSLFAQIGGVL